MGMIQTILVGELQDDPRIHTSSSGYKIASLRVEVAKEKIIKGERREFKSWHTVKVFGQQVELLEKSAKKGCTIFVKGEPRRNAYTKKDGTEAVTQEIAAEDFEILFGGSENSSATIQPEGGPFKQKQENADYPF